MALNVAIDGKVRWRIRYEKRGYYVVDEIVSSKGYYITWPQIFGSEEDAKDEMKKVLGITFKEKGGE